MAIASTLEKYLAAPTTKRAADLFGVQAVLPVFVHPESA